MLYDSTTGVLKAYSAHAATVEAHMAALPDNARENEQYKTAKALCRLLTSYMSRAMVSPAICPIPRLARCFFDSVSGTGLTDGLQFAEGEEAEILARMLFDGVSVLVPMLSTDLLLMPSLCRGFFELVAFLLDEYAVHVAVLPTELFGALMQSLQWGLDSPVDRVQTQRLCLQAMTAMAEHGLRSFASGGDSSVYSAESQHGAALIHFLQVMLQQLLFGEDVGMEMVDTAADLTFVLILCYEALFQQVSHLSSRLMVTTNGLLRF